MRYLINGTKIFGFLIECCRHCILRLDGKVGITQLKYIHTLSKVYSIKHRLEHVRSENVQTVNFLFV